QLSQLVEPHERSLLAGISLRYDDQAMTSGAQTERRGGAGEASAWRRGLTGRFLALQLILGRRVLFRRRPLPQKHRGIIAGGEGAAAVRRKSHGPDVLPMPFKAVELPAARHVPQAGGAVVGAG